MSKIQWETDLAEKPCREQLKVTGWQWIEGDKDVPEFWKISSEASPQTARNTKRIYDSRFLIFDF